MDPKKNSPNKKNGDNKKNKNLKGFLTLVAWALVLTVALNFLSAYAGNSVLFFEKRDIDLIEEFSVPANQAYLDADKLKWPLTLRRWQEGDWFIPFGMTGKKKVSDFLIDEKVSIMEKQRQFVLLSGDDIVWVVGRRTDERYRIGNKTENILKITKYTI